MTLWEWASTLLLFCLVPCGYLCFCGKKVLDRVIGFEMAVIVEIMILMLLSQSAGNGSFFDIALCLTVLAFGGSFVFVRFLERWC